MGQFDYRAKQSVKAAQWHGNNLEEMQELLRDVIEHDYDDIPMVYADYVEPYFVWRGKTFANAGYFMLKTENDEFDPGMWIVVYEDGEFEGMGDEQFNKMFEKA